MVRSSIDVLERTASQIETAYELGPLELETMDVQAGAGTLAAIAAFAAASVPDHA